MPGTPVGTENFISFALNQNATLIALSADDLPNNFSMSGVLPAASAGPASINADIYYEPAKNSMFIFNTLDSGQWSFMPMNNGGMIDESQHLQGDHGQWTLTALPVPEPHSAAMLLGGLSLLGLATRRRAA
ncbi:MAG: PEP-CTERM sorting domain-containing protein [Pseudomonadota bacterium]